MRQPFWWPRWFSGAAVPPHFRFPTIDDYGAAVDAFVAGLSDPNVHSFLVTNEQDHVVESDDTLDAVTLPWISQLVTDDPAWQSTTYAHP
jgi:hypothetical protein